MGAKKTSVGLWSFSEDVYAKVAHRSGIAPELSRLWFKRAFGTPQTTSIPQALSA